MPSTDPTGSLSSPRRASIDRPSVTAASVTAAPGRGAEPETLPPVRYDFDASQGIWRVTWGDQHFFSVGLRRARSHARAVFPADAVGEVIHVDNVLDGLIRQLRESPTPPTLHADVRNYVTTQELPLGVDDLSCLLEMDPDDVRNLLTNAHRPEACLSEPEPPSGQ